jgi:hypothetical protein
LILASGADAVVSFDQHYRSERREDRGHKTLYLEREGSGGFRIVGEAWRAEAAPRPAEILQAAATPRPTPTPAAVRRDAPALVVGELRAERDGAMVSVSFRLQRAVQDGRASSGRLVVLMSSANGRHYAYPRVPLNQGEPAQPGRGEWYSIRRFKIVKARLGPLEPGDRPVRLAYYIYDRRGVQLLERSLAWPGP